MAKPKKPKTSEQKYDLMLEQLAELAKAGLALAALAKVQTELMEMLKAFGAIAIGKMKADGVTFPFDDLAEAMGDRGIATEPAPACVPAIGAEECPRSCGTLLCECGGGGR